MFAKQCNLLVLSVLSVRLASYAGVKVNVHIKGHCIVWPTSLSRFHSFLT